MLACVPLRGFNGNPISIHAPQLCTPFLSALIRGLQEAQLLDVQQERAPAHSICSRGLDRTKRITVKVSVTLPDKHKASQECRGNVVGMVAADSGF